MRIIRDAILFPVTTTVGVILLVLFGFIGLFRLPVQLTPDIEQPEITVSTIWPGASPQEVEREIVDEQEEKLKSVEGLVKMESSSSDGQGTVTLTFRMGTNLDSSLLRVSNALQQVPSYPNDTEAPILRTVNPEETASAWFVLSPAGPNPFTDSVSTLWNFADDFVKPELERVPGVASSSMFGGQEQEMQVVVDPARLAARRITLGQLRDALEQENHNFSGGDFDEGKRRYVVRTVGEYDSPEDILSVVIAERNEVPVYLRDVGRAELGYRKENSRVFHRGEQVIAMNASRQSGANIIRVMEGLRETVARLNETLLRDRGLELVQVYDETDYIESAVDLVRESLVIGGFLAIAVLLLFLRSGSSVLIISIAIPISIVGSFLLMYLFGRTLNVISLAGMAFAVGMVVDNSIVVLENIYRHRQIGKSRREASHDGASEVWGAILASTLTTIAVFIPVMFIPQEVGQLFSDIALGISCAVGLSLLISITVIPSLSSRILGVANEWNGQRSIGNLWGIASAGAAFTNRTAQTVHWINRSIIRRLLTVTLLTSVSLGLSYWLAPKSEYLPIGNNNFMFGMILPPPGLNLDEIASLHDGFDEALRPMWEAEPGSPEAVAMPGGGVRNFFFVALRNMAFMGARTNDPLRVTELTPTLQGEIFRIPGAIGFVQQSSIFQSGFGEGRNIDVEITGPELPRLIQMGLRTMLQTFQVLPGSQAFPQPSLDLGNPEIQVRTDRLRASELGISNRDLAFTVSALIDGARTSDYQYQGRKIDLKVMAEQNGLRRTHLLEQLPIATPGGQIVTLGSIAEIKEVTGPQTINHSERRRVITVRITPPEITPLEDAMDIIGKQILDPMRQEGLLGGQYEAFLSGTADKLTETADALKWNFLLALVITYLLMAALFESFLYPFVIMFSVPLAAAGGVLGLWLINLHQYQALDVLTMLGFFILVGTVVNNAILIVHQSLLHIRRDAMPEPEAIRESVRTRIRPIFMSVGTSAFAMLPLVLSPGAGSELYRGLGSVVIGGLIVSTVFTLILVPAMLSLAFDLRNKITHRFRPPTHDGETPLPENR